LNGAIAALTGPQGVRLPLPRSGSDGMHSLALCIAKACGTPAADVRLGSYLNRLKIL